MLYAQHSLVPGIPLNHDLNRTRLSEFLALLAEQAFLDQQEPK